MRGDACDVLHDLALHCHQGMTSIHPPNHKTDYGRGVSMTVNSPGSRHPY